ncbi:MAG: alginate lyase family protein, partial [Gammaproteobacteria bacterium]|nr:alginate lyase family protein [Gammaproteobacteria bacterium]
MISFLQRLPLYYRTVRPLRFTQLLAQAYRRLRPVSNPPAVAAERCRMLRPVAPFCVQPEPEVAEFRFLNEAASADPADLNWQAPGKTRLWRYNLHYFDYLLWGCLPAAWKDVYIEDWIRKNPPGTRTAWEPYTVSLRIVNWIKYFVVRPGEVPPHWQHSLINQLHWLTHNLEHHILANHLLKNAKALLLGGLWFAGANGKRFLRLGEHYFIRELREQILPDGGHFERSPMYHAIVVEDCLDVLNCVHAEAGRLHPHSREAIATATERALEFLDDITAVDGQIPLFNDSAFGITPPPAALFAYAAAVCGYRRQPPLAAGEVYLVRRARSGYFGYRTHSDSMLIDCGAIGPDYQPGHAHCDMLSFELCIDGRRVIVDPGVHGYDEDETRAYLRSTAAHNTVVLNGVEQSEVWGTFRVGRRARPLDAGLQDLGNGRLEFSGSHDGYQRLEPPATHQRLIEIDVAGRWVVRDTVTGQGPGELLSYLHLAPEITARSAGPGLLRLERDGQPVADLHVPEAVEMSVAAGYVATGFGRREAADVIVMRTHGLLPLTSTFRLERVTPSTGTKSV